MVADPTDQNLAFALGVVERFRGVELSIVVQLTALQDVCGSRHETVGPEGLLGVLVVLADRPPIFAADGGLQQVGTRPGDVEEVGALPHAAAIRVEGAHVRPMREVLGLELACAYVISAANQQAPNAILPLPRCSWISEATCNAGRNWDHGVEVGLRPLDEFGIRDVGRDDVNDRLAASDRVRKHRHVLTCGSITNDCRRTAENTAAVVVMVRRQCHWQVLPMKHVI
mmetsp:Transcript_67930/g.192115  ORF Transcript_67930/g.192115 Transcript_67930/m.192115 type:complete len:227 (+) Transcript_67930:854-1534(+)